MATSSRRGAGRRAVFDTQDWALDVVGIGSLLYGPWTVGFKDGYPARVDGRARPLSTEQESDHVHAVGARLLRHRAGGGVAVRRRLGRLAA